MTLTFKKVDVRVYSDDYGVDCSPIFYEFDFKWEAEVDLLDNGETTTYALGFCGESPIDAVIALTKHEQFIDDSNSGNLTMEQECNLLKALQEAPYND